MRIDAHQHYWQVDRGDYGWMNPSMTTLYRDYLPLHLHPHLDQHQINYTIVVQAAPTIAETEFMLSLADQDDRIAGVVGWLDVEADDFNAQLLRLRANTKFVGIRPMLQDLSDDRYILRPKVIESLKVLVDQEIPLDILVFPKHLPIIIELMEKLPTLRGVIDHLAKPLIKQGILEPWQTHISELAKYPQLYCKLSGIVTEADQQAWKREDFRPYIQHVLASFGPSRVMFGSDWPVCLLAASYDEVVQVLNENLPDTLTAQDLQAIFGENAKRFYRLKVDSQNISSSNN